MTRKIVIEPVTRVEGHGKVTIHLDDKGNVDKARLHITQVRGFEKFCEGRLFWEMPLITARIWHLPGKSPPGFSQSWGCHFGGEADAHSRDAAQANSYGPDCPVPRAPFFPLG